MDKLKKILHIFTLFLLTIVIVGTSYLRLEFPDASIDELLFYLNNGVTHSDSSVFMEALKSCSFFVIILYLFFISLFYDLTFNHHFVFYPFKFILKHKIMFTIILIFITLLIVCYNMKLFTFAKNNISQSSFIEENYVFPQNMEITFNEKKNLILIVVESLETSLMDKDNGGSFNENYIPELTKLLDEDDVTVFYNNQNKIGMKMLDTANWTTASVIANTSSLPFKVPLFKKFSSSSFLNGAYTLYDLLDSNGYYNEVISSAYTSFGGLYDYFINHHVSNIIDIDSYQKYNLLLKENDKGLWGFNDNYLFKAAKERLNILSKNKEPFDLTLISIDTHFPNGFIGDYSVNKFKNQYANSYATTSKLIYDFIDWVRKQSFYNDTVIVIVGDHLSMQNNFFKTIDKNERFVYTCYVNATKKADNNKNRIYTALDTFPSILGAMGGVLEEDRLGLGTNMFSDVETLSEKYGFDYINKEMLKKSKFYKQKILN